MLEIIHSDICGLMQVGTHTMHTYFNMFIDDFLRYCDVYLVTHKLQAFDKFLQYESFVGNQINYKNKTLRSN